jgi:hypothetical protein
MKKKLALICFVFVLFITCSNNEKKRTTIIKHIVAYNYDGPIYWIAREKSPIPVITNDTIYIHYANGIGESGFLKTNTSGIKNEYYYDNNERVPFVTDTARCSTIGVGIVHSVIVKHSLTTNDYAIKRDSKLRSICHIPN